MVVIAVPALAQGRFALVVGNDSYQNIDRLQKAVNDARATAGWRGRRSAYIQLIGFGCLLFNTIVVSILVTGLHSYAGLN